MPDDTVRKPPLPLAVAFVACREIYIDQRTRSAILVGPTSHVGLHQFPAQFRLSVWVEFIGAHGRYQPRLCLLDTAENEVWGWSPPEPFMQNDPLFPSNATFYDLMLAVPRLGKYRLVLLFNGDELAQRSLWFGPKEAFRMREEAD